MKFLKRRKSKKKTDGPESNFRSIQQHIQKHPNDFPTPEEVSYMRGRLDAISKINTEMDDAKTSAEVNALFERLRKPPLSPFSGDLAKRWSTHYEFEQEVVRKLQQRREDILDGKPPRMARTKIRRKSA